jgi:hypothetical protein
MLLFVNMVLIYINMDDEDFTIEDGQTEPEIEPTELMTREQFLEYQGLKHDVKKDLLWAYRALGAKDLKPEDAPSPGAWFIYATTTDSDLAKKSFITGPLTKLLPSKSEMEKDDRAEDGRKIFNLIERLLREPDADAAVLSDVEKRAVKDGTRKLTLSATGS